MKKLLMLFLVVLLTVNFYAQSKSPEKDSVAAKTENAKPEKSVTRHSITIDGKIISYTAIAGTFIINDDKDEPEASIGYTAYLMDNVKDATKRPISFAFNGGPGSSSVWLHMGALGPKRIETSDASPTPPPPYKIVDNKFSILDKSDLVMIDPVGTGFSKAVGKKKDADFWGVDSDIKSVSQFILQYTSENGRWNSPKYLIGESYGTTRAAGIVDYLQTNKGMSFNGVVLVSSAMDLGALFDGERPYPFFLPTFAAVSWYHHLLPKQPEKLEPFLDEVRKYALGTYSVALMEGDKISDALRDSVAEKIHEFTGLSVEYVKKANLRVRESEYTQEMLRDKGETIGRYDARFTGVTFDKLAQNAQYDPGEAAFFSAFTAAIYNYLHDDLKFGEGKTYHIFGDLTGWDMKHIVPGHGTQNVVNTCVDLAHAMKYNTSLKVLVLQGYFDLATPFFATEYMVNHLDLNKKLQPNIAIKYFPTGHMMYLHEPSLEKMKSEIGGFIDSTDRLNSN